MVMPADVGAPATLPLGALAEERADILAAVKELFGEAGPTRIEVTSEDIASGRECDELYCPVASAIRHKTGLVYQVLADRIDPPWKRSGEPRASIPHPPELKKWIEKFDAGEKVEPFGFDLPPLD